MTTRSWVQGQQARSGNQHKIINFSSPGIAHLPHLPVGIILANLGLNPFPAFPRGHSHVTISPINWVASNLVIYLTLSLSLFQISSFHSSILKITTLGKAKHSNLSQCPSFKSLMSDLHFYLRLGIPQTFRKPNKARVQLAPLELLLHS